MNQNFADTENLVNNGKFSDSFAKHFASHFNNNDDEMFPEAMWETSQM